MGCGGVIASGPFSSPAAALGEVVPQLPWTVMTSTPRATRRMACTSSAPQAPACPCLLRHDPGGREVDSVSGGGQGGYSPAVGYLGPRSTTVWKHAPQKHMT